MYVEKWEAKNSKVVRGLNDSYNILSRRGLEVQLPGATVETNQRSHEVAKKKKVLLSVVSLRHAPLPVWGRRPWNTSHELCLHKLG